MFKMIYNIIRFILLILLQVLIINKIELSYYLNPMAVVFFIIALPLNTPNWLLLISSFFLGMTIDGFMNTPGIISFSLVLIAFCRPLLLKLFEPRDGYQPNDNSSVKKMGWVWYLKYATTITVTFHLIYFIILGISQDNLLIILWKTFVSSFFAIILFLLFQVFSLKDEH